MKKYLSIVLVLLSLAAPLLADTTDTKGGPNIPKEYTYSPDSLALYLDMNYANDDQKLEALYEWITHNMSYNVYITFQSKNEAPDEEKEIRTTLRLREGVCRQFALLFERVANALCIPVFMVNGYTRSSNVISPYPHSWCIAKVGSEWYCYDPTFDMGYTENQRFVSDPRKVYYRMAPQVFVRNHMPFDPIFQALPQPLYYQTFDNGEKVQAARQQYNFNDSILIYSRQAPIDQLRRSIQRVRTNGAPNRLIDYFLELSESNLKIYICNQVRATFYESMRLQNLAEDKRREMARKIKAGFKSMTDEDIKDLMEECSSSIKESDALLRSVTEIPDIYKANFAQLRQFIDNTMNRVEQVNEIGSKYLQAKPNKRKEYIRYYMQ